VNIGMRHEATGKRKIFCIALCAMLLALSYPAKAQQPKKVPRIGYVSGTGDANNPGPNIESFRQGLRDLSYVEGKNIVVEYRYAEGKNERLPGFVAELVKLKVDVVVVIALPAIRAAKKATQTIPIVMVTNTDPVAAGLVDSLARPGGNVTGLTLLTRDLAEKDWNCSTRWFRGYRASGSSGSRLL
jgi:putative tryptophan/tyrosine transport system substrate-binding protein